MHASSQISLSDMTSHKTWVQDVQAILWRYFDLITYIMYNHGAGRTHASGGEPPPLPTISLLEMRVFVRRAAVCSPYLNLGLIELMLPSIDGKRRTSHAALHDPEGRVTLPEFMEGLVRFSLYRQESSTQPKRPLPDCLVDLIEFNLTPAYSLPKPPPDPDDPNALLLAEENIYTRESVGEYLMSPLTELSGAIGRVLRIEARTCKALFGAFCKRDDTGQTIDVNEWVKMCVHARLLDAAPSTLHHEQRARTTLTTDDLVRLFGSVLVGGEASEKSNVDAIDLWATKFAGEQKPPEAGGGGGGIANLANNKSVAGCMIQCELDEAIARLALRKFDHDVVTPDAIKVHEVLMILKASLQRLPGGGGTGAPPGFAKRFASVTGPPRMPEGIYQQVTEAFEPRMVLTTTQSQHEAKGNAERKLAVDKMVNADKYAAWEEQKLNGPAKKADKGGKGGKKKK